jgi:hypothetical protein
LLGINPTQVANANLVTTFTSYKLIGIGSSVSKRSHSSSIIFMLFHQEISLDIKALSVLATFSTGLLFKGS